MEIAQVEIVRNTRGCLESARTEKGAVKRIKAEGLVTALVQQPWQAAMDVAGRDPRHRGSKAAERSNRKPREHVVLGEPAWSANPLHNKLAFPAVERSKMITISARHLDPGGRGYVEAGLIEDHKDVW